MINAASNNFELSRASNGQATVACFFLVDFWDIIGVTPKKTKLVFFDTRAFKHFHFDRFIVVVRYSSA